MSEFLHQDDARRSRILEAALVEFADKGYKKASTNTIVREAGVSKGLLFHYFISKKELFIYLYSFARKQVSNELYEYVNFADKDVLNRMRQSTLVKIESYLRHPLFVQLFEKLQDVQDEDILQAAYALDKQIQEETYEKLFSNIDYYSFEDTLNIDRCLQVVRWTVDKISNDWKAQHQGQIDEEAFEELSMDINHYLDLFRDAFYR
jgi:AcrR family transcriptional regulator